MGDDALLKARTWRWLRERITGLLTRPVTFVVLGNDAQHKPVTIPIYANRIQAAMDR